MWRGRILRMEGFSTGEIVTFILLAVSTIGASLFNAFSSPQVVDLILHFGTNLKPWIVINSFEEAVVLRLGGGRQLSPGGRPYHKVLGPGLHARFPFADQIYEQNVVPESSTFNPQTFVSKDGTAYLCQFHALHSIKDIVTYTCDVENADSVLTDAVAGTLRRVVASLTDEELKEDGLEQLLTERARGRAKRFGIYVERVFVSELAPMGLSKGVLRIGSGHIYEKHM